MDSAPAKPTPDQSAAHEFLVDLRTRIATQPLPYQYGTEARALESLWEVFSQARAAMKKYPGCERFAEVVTESLNRVLRPMTSKWHRAYENGGLNSLDSGAEFRGDLAEMQSKLRDLAEELHQMAYGTKARDALMDPVMSEDELKRCFRDVAFGVQQGIQSIPDNVVAGINEAEAKEVQRRREAHGLKTKPGFNAVGLAFSGGGIRSATFCLGVAQVLADRGLLKDVDFLSTVSGGGYTGSFLTVRLGTGTPLAGVAGPFGPDPAPVSYVRHHAKFLNPTNLKDAWSMVTGTLAGMVLNWTAPLTVVALAALAASGLSPKPDPTYWLTGLKFSAALSSLALIIYGATLRGERKSRITGGWILGICSAATVLAGLGWLIEAGYAEFERLADSPGVLKTLSLGGISAASLIAAGPALCRFLPLLQGPSIRALVLKVSLWLAGAIVPLTAVLLFYLGRHLGQWSGGAAPSLWNFRHFEGIHLLGASVVMLGAVAIFLLNVNLTAPHRIYRDRLAKTFIETAANDDRAVPLDQVNASGLAPYHLVNTTVNLPSSDLPALRDRACAFFLFSKCWTGSATSGFHPTTAWKTNGLPVDLATAMAISGAAASSYTGLGSKRTLASLLTLLNIRLGFWIRQPGKKTFSEAPGFSCLLREMAGVGMDEGAAWLNLSDGGHIENMAVYELLRRRCKFILCVDGEADPAFNFEGLLTLVRHARIDYGIRIEPDIDGIRPDPKTRCSRTHVQLCRIHYPAAPGASGAEPAAEIGLLLYVKLSVTGNESKLIERYRALHPEFPHEPTSDQFFTEEQFEAYRQLGVHAVEGLFLPALIGGNTHPASFPEWFRLLAHNLLVPA